MALAELLSELQAELDDGISVAKPAAGSNGVKTLLVGPSGTGKTYSLRTLPGLDKAVVIAAEIGDAALLGAELPVIKFIDYPVQIGRGESGLNRWNAYVKAIEKILSMDNIKCIVLDTLTEIQYWLMKDLLQQAGKPFPSLDIYGKLGQKMTDHIRLLRDCNKHIIVIAHDKTEKDEEEGIITRKANVIGSLRDTIEREFDVVLTSGILKAKNESQYIWRTQKDLRYVAKDRFNVLPKPVMEQDWTAFYGWIMKGATK